MAGPPRRLTAPAVKGSYALLLRLEETAVIQVGKLGEFAFTPGYYLYLGSALGSGGLAARLRRHLTADKRPFWHIDYLRQRTAVASVWYAADGRNWEHSWAAAALELPGAAVPAPRFGASDCRCPTHLIFFADNPPLSKIWGVQEVIKGYAD